MNSIVRTLVCSAALGVSLPLAAAPALVPNGDFETPAGASWEEVSGGGTYEFSYPAAGGNPGGYGIIDHSDDDGPFGIWVANEGVVLPLSSLGLTAGEAYRFSQDMKIESGDTVGGFKVDFFTGNDFSGSTGDLFPDLIGDGSTWETYEFKVSLPVGVDGIKVVPLWGSGSVVGYDNICFDTTPIVVPPIPNADFEDGGTAWLEIGDPETVFGYPATGGNPAGHGVMTNNGGGVGFWVANGGAPLPLSSLGLAGGDTVTFMQDMILFSGSNIGGLRVEYLEGADLLGDSGNMTPELIGDGNTWETYAFEITIPLEADHIKVSPLWGPGSSVGFDNIGFVRTPVVPLALNFELGTAVTWNAPSEFNLYQPQGSANGVDWTDLGPVVVGDEVTTAFDPDDLALYRVLESEVDVTEAALNGGFERPDAVDPALAESWTPFGTQPPIRITTDFRSGTASLRIASKNDATPTANTSEIQQSLSASRGEITPGASYDLSFWAKQITSGVSYVQQYRLQWLDGGGAILPGGTNFTPFSGGTGEWSKTEVTGLVAPEGVETALLQIFGNTGAVAGSTAQGEVLIDDVSIVAFSTRASSEEAVLNGDHELLDFNDSQCSESWICDGTQRPTNIIYDSRSGIASVELSVRNTSAAPNTSEIRQNIFDAGGSITPGASYDFSFWAKQVTTGANYEQRYRFQWLDAGGGILPGGIALTSFAANANDWSEIAVRGLVAPDLAVSAVIQFVASTGAVPGAEGLVLIDDVSLAGVIPPTVLEATSAAGLEISWATEAGKTYQLRRSPELETFADFGPAVMGDGGILSATDVITSSEQFYQVVETMNGP